MNNEKNKKFEALENLQANNEQVHVQEEENISDSEYRKLEKSELPFQGRLYPESWEVAYRCPTPDEIADFSTINEEDQAGIINAISELVRKCFLIYDVKEKKQISSSQLNDGEKMFFFLKLREFYLDDNAPIKYIVMNQMYSEPVEISFTSNTLQYPELKEELLERFDGRVFHIDDEIKFHIPTIAISQKIFKYVVAVYKEIDAAQNGKKQKNTITEKSIDKKFLLIAPYLFVTGEENMQSLKQKYIQVTKNPKLYKKYITIANSLNLTNLEYITYNYKESEEEALIKFPMGWRKIFDDTEGLSKLF